MPDSKTRLTLPCSADSDTNCSNVFMGLTWRMKASPALSNVFIIIVDAQLRLESGDLSKSEERRRSPSVLGTTDNRGCIARDPQTAVSEFAASEIGLRPLPTFAALGCESPAPVKFRSSSSLLFLIGVHRRSSAAGMVLFLFGFQKYRSAADERR